MFFHITALGFVAAAVLAVIVLAPIAIIDSAASGAARSPLLPASSPFSGGTSEIYPTANMPMKVFYFLAPRSNTSLSHFPNVFFFCFTSHKKNLTKKTKKKKKWHGNASRHPYYDVSETRMTASPSYLAVHFHFLLFFLSHSYLFLFVYFRPPLERLLVG